MVEEEHKENDETLMLKQKVGKGMANIVNALFEDRQVKEAIRRNILKETFRSGIVMSLIILGGVSVINGVKQLLLPGPQTDLFLGIALIIIGAIYKRKIERD